MEKIIARSGAFVGRVYTTNEQLYCSKTARPVMHYAARFAAKEAASKALGVGLFSSGIRPVDIEVSHDGRGRPVILLHGKAAEIAKAKHIIDMPLSLSHTHTVAVANVVAITEASKLEKEKKNSTYDEITRQFKDAKSFIDELSQATRASISHSEE